MVAPWLGVKPAVAVRELTARTMYSMTLSTESRWRNLAIPWEKLVVKSVVVLLYIQHGQDTYSRMSLAECNKAKAVNVQFREHPIECRARAAGNRQYHPLILPDITHRAGGGGCIPNHVDVPLEQRLPLVRLQLIRRMHASKEWRFGLFGHRSRRRQGGLGGWAALTNHIVGLRRNRPREVGWTLVAAKRASDVSGLAWSQGCSALEPRWVSSQDEGKSEE